ncbi:cytochrome P450 18a1-like [Monomorium pharaonis]|uniref:cytochrome P450 18a1-like n=1 Tax=Monomorium pharaonis TaxID=307658 RepID=UPI00063EFE29|nr:cytochrome P450 18a1-like [Monomorium pharaonis]XP_036141188.1 cytochrome P450 18a1-like [Monomorium pharaonis]XP_036141189.1 cytochrome P450 18a1-like [Monomorium pharaonis]
MFEFLGGVWGRTDTTNYDVFRTFLIFISVLLVVKWLRCNCTLPLPPGPWGWPIVGYLPYIKGAVHLQYTKLAKKYGPIFSVKFGSHLIVVLSDHEIIREAFRLMDYAGRPHTDFMKIIDGYGIVNSEGTFWNDHRTFLLRIFRGLNKDTDGGIKAMEKTVMDNVNTFLKKLKNQEEAPINISPYLAVSISNVICSLTMSVNFEDDDPTFKRFMDLIDEGFRLFAQLTYPTYIPLLRFFPWIHGTRNKLLQNRIEMDQFFQRIIDNHKRDFEEGRDFRDVVDAYIQKKNNPIFHGKDEDHQMRQIMGDLFSAGMETVKTTLEWSMVYMLNYPKLAKEVQDELDQIVGRSRLPSKADMNNLPITHATILEIIRRSNLVPLGTTHATTRDVTLNGYKLPVGTQVIPLLYAVHMDPLLWGDPENFRPRRFISEEGKVKQPDYYMPFGTGKRSCLGKQLAEMEIFLFFSSLMHMYNLNLPKGDSKPSLEGNVGVTISPKTFKLCLQYRSLDETGDDEDDNGGNKEPIIEEPTLHQSVDDKDDNGNEEPVIEEPIKELIGQYLRNIGSH